MSLKGVYFYFGERSYVPPLACEWADRDFTLLLQPSTLHPHTLPTQFNNILYPPTSPTLTHIFYPPTSTTLSHCTHKLYPPTLPHWTHILYPPTSPTLSQCTHIIYLPTSPTYTSPTYFTHPLHPHILSAPTYCTHPQRNVRVRMKEMWLWPSAGKDGKPFFSVVTTTFLV